MVWLLYLHVKIDSSVLVSVCLSLFRLVAQIHDELLFEVEISQLEQFAGEETVHVLLYEHE